MPTGRSVGVVVKKGVLPMSSSDLASPEQGQREREEADSLDASLDAILSEHTGGTPLPTLEEIDPPEQAASTLVPPAAEIQMALPEESTAAPPALGDADGTPLPVTVDDDLDVPGYQAFANEVAPAELSGEPAPAEEVVAAAAPAVESEPASAAAEESE